MQQDSPELETGHSLSTPPALARELAGWLIYKARAFNPSSRTSVIDPQCGAGWFLSGVQYAIGRQSHWGFPILNGFDIDPAQEAQASDNIRRVTGHCVACERALGAIIEADPTCGKAFDISVCNPPFGTRWKVSDDGTMMDSVAWTWRFATSNSNCGVIICPEEFEGQCQIPPDQRGRIRIIDRKVFRSATYWPSRVDGNSVAITWERFGSGLMRPFSWQQGKLPFIMQAIRDVMADERRGMPSENIWLDGQLLKSNASILDRIRKNLSRDDVERLGRIDGKHPVTLAADIETRNLLKDFASSRVFSISPDALSAINGALSDSANGCVPIMPVTDFQRLAYCDDIGQIRCVRNYQPRGSIQPVFRQDRLYRVYPRTYNKSSFYSRNQQVFNEASQSASLVMKDYMLLGEDKELVVVGDGGRQVRFRTTTKETALDMDEGKFFDFFEKPSVQSVAEKFPAQYERNKNILLSMEACGGFGFYDGQIDYLARTLVRDSAIIAAETGSGKTLCAIAAIIAKGAKRALIIAPQATTRSSDPEEEEEDEPTGMTASQWHSEIEKFAGYMKVYDLFSMEDYERLILPDGTLPFGIYVSYYEAFLTNGAIEERPPSWTHNRRLRDYVGAAPFLPGDDFTDEVDSIGETEDGTGIRCIVKPSLATICGDQFDWIGVDEAHMLANVDAKRTKTFIRLQSKCKYAFTATPIKNRVDDLFPVMGWLCVPDWYKGGRCSSAWPYRREDYNLFLRTYLCAEVDIDQKARNAVDGKSYTPKKTSVISSPARLLRIISPTVAYISKSNCSSTYVKPKISDIRVPLGAQQARLYQFYSDLANVPGGKTPRVRYARQLTILRGICTDPVALDCNRPPAPVCSIDLTPKVLCVLNLAADILTKGEQVVIVNSRHVITDVIEKHLKQAGVGVSRIDSTVNPDDQPAQSRMFKDGKTRVLLMGIKCAQGHNYPMCPNLVVSSLEYSNGALEQALGRVDRLNSVRVPSIYVILNKGTIEEMMFDIVATKDDSARICLRGHRAPRDFKPVDISEVLAESLYRPSSFSDVIPEETCQAEWPDILGKIKLAV